MVAFQGVVEEPFVWFWCFLLAGVVLHVFQVNRFGLETLASRLGVNPHGEARLWFNVERQDVTLQGLLRSHPRVGKDVNQWLTEDNVDSSKLVSQLLPGPHVERNPRPAVVIKHQLGRYERFSS